MQQKKVFALCGSTKKNSTNEQLLNYIAHHFQEDLDVSIFTELDQLPHFNPDVDQDNPPEVALRLRQGINTADGVILCTPEYVFSLPGVLKNAIEWCVSTTVFSNKPVAFIVASASGEKAFEALELILRTIETRMHSQANLLIRGAKGKMKEQDLPNEEVQLQIKKMMAAFMECMDETNVVPTKYKA